MLIEYVGKAESSQKQALHLFLLIDHAIRYNHIQANQDLASQVEVVHLYGNIPHHGVTIARLCVMADLHPALAFIVIVILLGLATSNVLARPP